MKCLQGLIRWMRQKGVGIYICKSECASIACFSAILNRSKEKFENESPGMSLRKHLGTNWNFAVFQKYMCRSSAAISLPLFVNCVQTFWISVPGPGMLQVVTRRTWRSWLQLTGLLKVPWYTEKDHLPKKQHGTETLIEVNVEVSSWAFQLMFGLSMDPEIAPTPWSSGSSAGSWYHPGQL